MRAIVLALLLLSGCATSSPRPDKPLWARLFNAAVDLPSMEHAARLMEQDDYIRHREQLAGNFTRDAGTNPPTELEREFVYFKIAESWLFYRERDKSDEAVEHSNIYMRKLLEVPNRHAMSDYVIARIQELNGENYSSKIPIPKGMVRWSFHLGTVDSNNPTFLLNDFRKEYAAIRESKRAGLLKMTCFVLLPCVGGIKGDDELVVHGLSQPIGISIIDANGQAVILKGMERL